MRGLQTLWHSNIASNTFKFDCLEIANLDMRLLHQRAYDLESLSWPAKQITGATNEQRLIDSKKTGEKRKMDIIGC
jgi:hypothetical protein